MYDLLKYSRRHLQHLFEWWIAYLQRNALAVFIISVLFTAGVLYYSVRNFALDTDLSGMISEKLPFRRDEKAFRKAFPQLSNNIVVVIEADTVEGAVAARNRLAGQLRKEKRLFKDVYAPGGGTFFEKNGLLYLDVDQLQDLSDSLAAAQPLLALLTKDLSLSNFFSVFRQAVEKRKGVEIPQGRMDTLFDAIDHTVKGVMNGSSNRLSWQYIVAGQTVTLAKRRQFIILQPYVNPRFLSGAKVPLEAIRNIARKLGLDAAHGIRVRLTGDIALANENLTAIQGNLGIVIFASFILVVVTMAIGVGGSPLLTVANMLTLAVGLVWTSGFAIASLGAFNLISITFAVIYIGVGIDFSLLFCLIYREYLRRGSGNTDAVTASSINVGKGLFLCMATEAIGFYSFVPTAYAGASNLGLIAGTGMIINLVVTFTILPALFTLVPLKRKNIRESRITGSNLAKKVAAFPYRHARGVTAGAALLGLGSAVLLPGLHFDYNPLNLYNPTSEAVMTAQELFRDSFNSPWSISVLAEGAKEARQTAERIDKLKEVKSAVTIFDFVPANQNEKLAIISDMALFIPPLPPGMGIRNSTAAEDLKELSGFMEELKRSYISPSAPPNPHAARLYKTLNEFRKSVLDTGRGRKEFSALETDLLSNLPDLLGRLELLLHAAPVEMGDLPREMVNQYVAADGRYRIQVFPSENIAKSGALKRFVTAVRSIAPHATDTPVSIYESGKAVVSSFTQATLYALVAITIFLLFELRSLLATVLILIPFALAFLMTAATSVLLHVPLNFANIIVLPLLLGLGIDNAIHFIYRYRRDPSGNLNVLETSTSRAVYYNTATSVVGFCTLIWMPHRGLASMGIVLTLCMAYVMICTFTFLPALMELFGSRLHVNRDHPDN
jgi:hopanoid biosynthesis associated RND transporter like protein HpnN